MRLEWRGTELYVDDVLFGRIEQTPGDACESSRWVVFSGDEQLGSYGGETFARLALTRLALEGKGSKPAKKGPIFA